MSDLTLAPSHLPESDDGVPLAKAIPSLAHRGHVELPVEPVPLPRVGRPGLTPPSGRFEPTTFLSDVVLALGLADGEQVEGALQTARNPGQTLERVLLESHVLNEDELAHALAERHGIAHIDLTVFAPDPRAEDLLALELARRYEALPVSRLDEQTVLLAMADPGDWLAADEIARLTGSKVRRAAAARSALHASIDAASQRERVADRDSAPSSAEQGPAEARSPVRAAPPVQAVSAPSSRWDDAVENSGAPVAGSAPHSSERRELERWLAERWLSERIGRLDRERAELENERAELMAQPLR